MQDQITGHQEIILKCLDLDPVRYTCLEVFMRAFLTKFRVKFTSRIMNILIKTFGKNVMFLLYLQKNLAINYLWVTRYSIQATINEYEVYNIVL